MKKVTALVLSVILLACLFTACNTKSSKAYTFTVDNGDKIKIELNTADDYDLSSELPFTISCDGQTLSQGSFVLAESYQQYVSVVNTDENAKLIDSGTKDGNEYIFWCYNGSEYNYAVLIKESNTGIVIGNPISEESAKGCFDRLIISLED